MSASPLIQTWSLSVNDPAKWETTPAPTPSNFERWLLGALISNCWGARFISNLLDVVPSSKTRLRDEGLKPFYNIACSTDKTFKAIATKKGITLPSYPDVSEDWREELAVKPETLQEAFQPCAEEPLKELMVLMSKMMDAEQGYHWGSLATLISVWADAYVNPAKKGSAGTAKDEGVALDGDAMRDEGVAMFMETMKKDGGMSECARVLREELMECRSSDEGGEWNEEEAKELTKGYLGLLGKVWAIGKE